VKRSTPRIASLCVLVVTGNRCAAGRPAANKASLLSSELGARSLGDDKARHHERP
jgi:hypothetical protein